MPDEAKTEAITEKDRQIASRYRFFTDSVFSSLGLAKKGGVEATKLVADVARDLMYMSEAQPALGCTALECVNNAKDPAPAKEPKPKATKK